MAVLSTSLRFVLNAYDESEHRYQFKKKSYLDWPLIFVKCLPVVFLFCFLKFSNSHICNSEDIILIKSVYFIRLFYKSYINTFPTKS